MAHILGIPNFYCQGIPNSIAVRLAYMETWHSRLKFAREKAGLQQNEAAAKVGVKPASFSDWESGETKNIEGANLLKVCDLLNISPKWLLFGEGKMESEAYVADKKAKAVLLAMQQMPEYKKDMLVAASNTLSEQPDQGATGTK